MTVVKLFKIDEPEEALAAVFDDGDHFIGRGTYLSDRRISRQHGLLKVTKDAITFTAVHQNPCYYKTETGNVAMLLKGESITLRNNAEFSCLKEHSWLKVAVCDDENQPATDVSTSANLCNKRKNSFDAPGTSKKHAKTDESSAVINSAEYDVAVPPLQADLSVKDANATVTSGDEIKEEPAADENINAETADVDLPPIKTEEIKQEVELTDEPAPLNCAELANCASGVVKEENGENSEHSTPTENDKNNTNTSGEEKDAKKPKREWRDRCWYGKSCYRKNLEHKASFSHPGDSDYDTDPNDDRPSCSYGGACYRRNPAHRKDFKHPSNGGPKPKLKRAQTKPKLKKQTSTALDDCEDAEDDYDLEDPFIDDDSEDDFQPEDDDDTDSEWGDSQEIDEEDDTKLLLKEAKRITRNKARK